jgi:hypothetical protein
VLAKDRYEPGLDVGELTLPVAFDANPLIGTPLLVERLNVDRDIVLCLAGNNTGLTTGAPVQVHYHSPFMVYSTSCNH